MLETGARFSNELYIKTSLDPSDGSCTVELIKIDDGVETVISGAVTWED